MLLQARVVACLLTQDLDLHKPHVQYRAGSSSSHVVWLIEVQYCWEFTPANCLLLESAGERWSWQELTRQHCEWFFPFVAL